MPPLIANVSFSQSMTGGIGELGLPLRQSFVMGVISEINANKFLDTFNFSIAEQDVGTGLVTSPVTGGLIGQALTYRPGVYLEIGSRFGGSAIIALQFTEEVVCIDPWYEQEFCDVMVTLGREDQVTKIVKYSMDVKRLPKKVYTVGFIDGLHTMQSCMNDLDLMKNRVSDHIILDDYNIAAVRRSVRKFIWENPRWHVSFAGYSTVVVSTNLDQMGMY